MVKKLQLKPFYATREKKGLSTIAVVKEINYVEGPGTVNNCVAQKWFRCFKEVDTSLKDKPRTGKTSVVKDRPSLKWLNNIQAQALVHC